MTKTLQALLRSIPMMVLIFLISMVVHTYLLVFYNEGFGAGTWVGNQLLATQGRVISGTLLWMLVSGFLFMAIPRIRQMGFGPFFSELAKTPGVMADYVKQAGGDGLLLLLSGIGVSLIIASIMSSATSLATAVGLAAVFASPVGRVLAILIQTSWTTLVAGINPNQAQAQAAFGIIPAYVALVGSSLGFVGAAIIPFSGWLGVLLLIVVAVMLYNSSRPGGTTTASLLFFLITVAILVLKAKGVLADDGGWAESGGNFQSWVQSEGSVRAVLHGTGPSLGAAVGPAFTSTLSGISPDDFSLPQDSKGQEKEKGEISEPPEEQPQEETPISEEDQEESEPEEKTYDEESYDEDGYDKDGFDREGYDREGYNREGYDREGYDREGLDRNGFDRDGFDRDGFDAEGFDREGYDRNGFDAKGYDREGYDRNGFDAEGYDRKGFDKNGYDREGYDREGYTRKGFNRDGVNRQGKTFEEVREELRDKLSQLEKEQASANSSAWWWDVGTKSVELVQFGADKSIDLLEKLTGPAGQNVKMIYTVAKGTAEGLGEGMAEGKDYLSHMAKGTFKGVVDLGLDKLKDAAFGKITDMTGGKIPGFKDYTPFNLADEAWKNTRTGFVKDALLGKGVDESVTGMIRDKFATAGKSVIQDTIRDKLSKDPIMDKLFGKE